MYSDDVGYRIAFFSANWSGFALATERTDEHYGHRH